MSIAVSAATGNLGKIIVDILHGKGQPFVALARDPSKVREGVEARKFDYESDVATLAASLAGVKTLIFISSGDYKGDRLLQHRNTVDAAKQAGVTTILYTSMLFAPTTEISVGPDHSTTEEYIAASGLKHAFLRNGLYLDIWTEQLATITKTGALLNAKNGAKVSPAPRRDFAEAAVNAAVLANEGRPLKVVYELGGEAITMEELADEISLHSGKAVKSIFMPVEELGKLYLGFGLHPRVVEVATTTESASAKGGMYVETTDLVELLGHPPYNWKQYVKEAVAALPSA
ncbi:NmrA family transcriptional regulator [Zopfochytrium polystomum]|nr:NmrA family transcriptional regulator [Zopfochytrium polystomum]